MDSLERKRWTSEAVRDFWRQALAKIPREEMVYPVSDEEVSGLMARYASDVGKSFEQACFWPFADGCEGGYIVFLPEVRRFVHSGAVLPIVINETVEDAAKEVKELEDKLRLQKKILARLRRRDLYLAGRVPLMRRLVDTLCGQLAQLDLSQNLDLENIELVSSDNLFVWLEYLFVGQSRGNGGRLRVEFAVCHSTVPKGLSNDNYMQFDAVVDLPSDVDSGSPEAVNRTLAQGVVSQFKKVIHESYPWMKEEWVTVNVKKGEV